MSTNTPNATIDFPMFQGGIKELSSSEGDTIEAGTSLATGRDLARRGRQLIAQGAALLEASDNDLSASSERVASATSGLRSASAMIAGSLAPASPPAEPIDYGPRPRRWVQDDERAALALNFPAYRNQTARRSLFGVIEASMRENLAALLLNNTFQSRDADPRGTHHVAPYLDNWDPALWDDFASVFRGCGRTIAGYVGPIETVVDEEPVGAERLSRWIDDSKRMSDLTGAPAPLVIDVFISSRWHEHFAAFQQDAWDRHGIIVGGEPWFPSEGPMLLPRQIGPFVGLLNWLVQHHGTLPATADRDDRIIEALRNLPDVSGTDREREFGLWIDNVDATELDDRDQIGQEWLDFLGTTTDNAVVGFARKVIQDGHLPVLATRYHNLLPAIVAHDGEAVAA